jgi:hypothetical protein
MAHNLHAALPVGAMRLGVREDDMGDEVSQFMNDRVFQFIGIVPVNGFVDTNGVRPGDGLAGSSAFQVHPDVRHVKTATIMFFGKLEASDYDALYRILHSTPPLMLL